MMDMAVGKVPDEAGARRSAQAQERLQRTVGDFGRLLQGGFRRHDPHDADRTPISRAARLVASHLGLKPNEIEPADDESDDAFLERFAASSGARVRLVGLDDLAALEGEGPIVARGPADQPVVLLPGRLSGLVLLDPITGQRSRLRPGRDGHVVGPGGVAFHPVLPAGKLGYRAIVGFGLGACIPAMLAVIGCGIAESLLGLMLPLSFAFVANAVIPTGNLPLLLQVCGAVAGALLLETAVHLVGQVQRLGLEGRAGLALHAAMLDRVLRLPAAVLRQSSTAILATQAETVDKFRRPLLNHAATIVLAAIHGVAAAGLMCVYAPSAGLVAIGSVLLLLAVTAIFGRLQFKAIYEGERMDVVVLTFVYDLIRMVPLLQAQRAERQAFVQWAQNFLAFQSRIMRSTAMANVLAGIEGGWEVFTLAACFIAVSWAGLGGGLTTGAAVAFVVSLGKLNAAGLESAHALLGTAKLLPMAKLARSLIEQQLPGQVGGAAVPVLQGAVRLDAVSFGYDTRPVLRGAELDIAAGEFVGICGPSGSGKSTILRLVLGLDQPSAGAVLIDGFDVRALDQAGLSAQMGVVLQNGQLWAGTIFENMRGDTGLTLDAAWALARQVGLAAELEAMPMGLQTIVGEGGLGLSRGQVQRILIVRALAGDPRILVMDEPAATLQGEALQPVLDLLAALPITRILVSHDPVLLAAATRVVELRDGRLSTIRAGGEA
jgi:ABC-type bacteriocin/lantibiotic exporter with double-glycine peptidase domain